jgi:hypothetical protein
LPSSQWQAGALVTALIPRDGHLDLFATDGIGVVCLGWAFGPRNFMKNRRRT